ncbi:MAG: LytTR family DNA-binding domain-containing protein [Daejeonella sp.]
MKLSAIVVDDEEYSRESIKYLIAANCPNVDIKATACSVSEARQLLKTYPTDIVFLDIAMPEENGFALIPDLEANETSVVFTTAFNEYALRALKASAIDYLLKPVNIDELKVSVQKVIAWKLLKQNQKIDNKTYTETLNRLVDNMNNGQEILTLSLPNSQGFKIINISDIIYLEADNNYTCFYFCNENKVVVSKPMKVYQDVLDANYFVKIHKSTIINLNYLKDFNNQNGYVVKMKDDTELSVSRRRTTVFLDKVKFFLNR